MEQRLSLITLGVENINISKDFYIKKLGWKATEQSNENIVFIKLNGLLLSLYQKEKLAEDAKVNFQNKGFQSFTLAYCTRTKQEVDSLFESFNKLDVEIIKEPENAFWGGYSGYICDPDKYLWEIAFNPYLQFDAKGDIV